MKKRIAVPILLAVCLLSALTLAYFTRDDAPAARMRISATPFMEEVAITQKKDGSVSLMVNASKAVFLNDSDVRLTNLTVVLPEKGLTLASNSGLFNIRDKNVKIDGSIRASAPSYTINASSVAWDPSRKELTSPEGVTIEGTDFRVQGKGLEATKDKAKLLGNVKAVFYEK